MSLVQAADVFTTGAGVEIRVEALRRLVKLGAPTNDDDTINLLHLTAWLAGRVS